jgi:uncharacterized membrane protein YbhN (UPF0104 family)
MIELMLYFVLAAFLWGLNFLCLWAGSKAGKSRDRTLLYVILVYLVAMTLKLASLE